MWLPFLISQQWNIHCVSLCLSFVPDFCVLHWLHMYLVTIAKNDWEHSSETLDSGYTTYGVLLVLVSVFYKFASCSTARITVVPRWHLSLTRLPVSFDFLLFNLQLSALRQHFRTHSSSRPTVSTVLILLLRHHTPTITTYCHHNIILAWPPRILAWHLNGQSSPATEYLIW